MSLNDQQTLYYRSAGINIETVGLLFGILSVLFVFMIVSWPLLPITIPVSVILGGLAIYRVRKGQDINLKAAMGGLILGVLALLLFINIVTR